MRAVAIAIAVCVLLAASAEARRPTTVHLLMGLGDSWTSPGVITQANQIKALGSDVTATVWKWYEWASALADLQAKPNTKHVVIGYSNGASFVQNIANSGVLLDLLISEDPTIWLPTYPLKSNVQKAICFKNTNPYSSFPPVGHASLVAGPGFPPSRLTTIETKDQHLSVDTDPTIIKTVVDAVNLVVQQP